MLKALSCWSPSCRGIATLPDGKPYTMAAPPAKGRKPFTYRCAKCRQQNVLSTVEFNRLPTMTFDALKAAGLTDVILQDLPDITEAQLAELHAAGVHLGELHPAPGSRGYGE